MNSGKEMLAVDFVDGDDIRLLRRIIAAADLVIEASRPRAVEQIGIYPTTVVAGLVDVVVVDHGPWADR